jgi:hypothetical protein
LGSYGFQLLVDGALVETPFFSNELGQSSLREHWGCGSPAHFCKVGLSIKAQFLQEWIARLFDEFYVKLTVFVMNTSAKNSSPQGEIGAAYKAYSTANHQ